MTDNTCLSRLEAEAYIIKKYGNPAAVTAKTLAKMATTGGGPILHHFGRRVGYKPADLDSWVMSRCSGPQRSTSDKQKQSSHTAYMPQ